MKHSKLLGKNTFFLAAATVAALVSGSACAGTVVTGSSSKALVDDTVSTPAQPVQNLANVQMTNQRKNTCARFYVPTRTAYPHTRQQFTIAAKNYELGTMKHTQTVFEIGKPVMASVFNGKCGGAAVQNVWFTPFKPRHPADVEYFTVK